MKLRTFAVLVAISSLTLPSTRLKAGDDGDCGQPGPAVPLPATKLFIEHNATNEDTGVHGLFDGIDWTKLCVYDPRGRLVLEVEPDRPDHHLPVRR
jgi:hypothetical protein